MTSGPTRVLVTGAAGNIGQVVVRRLLQEQGFEVRASDERELPSWIADSCEVHRGDLRDRGQARLAMRDCTHVIHLAAIVGGIANFHQLAYTLTEVNSALYNAVFGAALELELERFVYVSSSMVYERATAFPTTEEYLPRCPTPQSAYGFSKLAGEFYARAAHRQFGFPFTICRPANAYGPGELPEAEPGITHVIPDLIGKVLDGQRPLQLFGSGRQTRAFTYFEDTADGIVTAMLSPAGLHEDFNITSSEEVTIAELGALVWEACRRDAAQYEFESVEQPYETDVQRRLLSGDKARRLLGWEPKVTLREGLRATADWMAEERSAAGR